jgi:hypothetical protein
MPILKAVRPLPSDLSEHPFQHRHWSEGDLEPLSSFDRLDITSYRETMSEGPSEIPPIENLSPEEANRIIHSHRKVRYGTQHSLPLTSSGEEFRKILVPPLRIIFTLC